MKKLTLALLALFMLLIFPSCSDQGNSTPQNNDTPSFQGSISPDNSGLQSDVNSDSGTENEDKASVTVYSQPLTVSKLIENYNLKLQSASITVLIDNAYVTIHENAYFYGLTQDMGFYVYPVEYSGDQTKDIALEMGVFVSEDSKNADLCEKYLYCLLKANLSSLDDEDISFALKEAKSLAKLEGDGQYIDMSNGLYLGYDSDFDGNIRYVVMRVYEK